MALAVGLLALAGVALNLAALVTGGPVALGLLSLVITGWIAARFTRIGLRRLRAIDALQRTR